MTKNGELAAYIHSVETAGMVDGPGIRYTIFFQGCALRCKYCHNPDTWKLMGGQEMTVAEVLEDVLRYRSFMRFSGGGVTITGGDPFMQPEFLIELLAALKTEGLHTALDTAGYTGAGNAEKALVNTDLLLLDIKSIDPDTYKDLTGVRIDASLRMLDIAHKLGVETWIRFVLVPDITDNFDHIHQMRDFLAKYDNITKIEVLPFHKMGEYKWEDLGIKYELHDTQPPEADVLAKAREILSI
ncbi:MAG: pyruvate formate-lyase-activating protein [Defluviitaleaceae bacterium]|nr:pyruvate formate-lyase-activating protein [Defluviitaleaceae bacterium]